MGEQRQELHPHAALRAAAKRLLEWSEGGTDFAEWDMRVEELREAVAAIPPSEGMTLAPGLAKQLGALVKEQARSRIGIYPDGNPNAAARSQGDPSGALRPEPEAAGQDPVVGHKTFRDGPLGFRHEPLRQSEADAIMASVRAADARRVELMPDEQSAIRMMFEARQRLIGLGWRDATYCPKDGREFDVIEPGSTGIHRCHYSGEWPTGSWWITDERDIYPSRPVLFRLSPTSVQLPEPPQAASGCSHTARSDGAKE